MLDLWTNPNGGEAKNDNLPPKGQVWFAHPVYFLNHLDKAGLLDKTFNPYEGTHKTAEGVTFTCYDNPGFAPVYTVGTEVFEDRGKRFAVINGLFNDDYSRFYGRRFFHEGIDFKGIEGTKIISFVYGTVVFEWLINEKEPVYPDMEVAEVGKTGTKAAHLHVSVLETSESDKERIVTSVSAEQYRWNISVFNLCRDPFNQTITRIP
jgi:murein DD-endopeptidase MepM/ murein hydrolase activator NlpD